MTAIERFRADLATLLPHGWDAGSPVALAVSGGPDSMAMLWLAAQSRPGNVVAATVDHGLRAESAAEAEQVAVACARLAVPHATLRPAAAIGGGNLHAAARTARYALLGAWAIAAGARALATAHHLDDQAETFLMRAVRGAGPAGLAGVRAQRSMMVERDGAAPPATLAIVRPLLGWRRVELAAIAAAANLPVADDPSNRDPRFERARIRAFLADSASLDPAGLAQSARHIGEVEAALASAADALWRHRAVQGQASAEVALDPAGLLRELRRRLARRAIATVRQMAGLLPPFDPATNIEPLLDALDAGRAATQADVLVHPRDGIWHFRPAPARRPGG